MADESHVDRLLGLRAEQSARGDFGLVREIDAQLVRLGVDPVTASIGAGSAPGVLEHATPQGAETTTSPKRGPGRPRKAVN